MSPDLDRRVFADLSYGLYIVTSRDGDQMNGQVVNTVIQVTSDPARVAVIINKKNLTHDFINRSKVFGVTVLDESTPMKFLGPFGFRSGRDIYKFSEVQFKEGVTGCPLVTEHAVSLLEAEVFDQIDLGTHTIFVGNAVNTEVLREGRPLTYQYYRDFLKGKSPPNAPTYTPSKQVDKREDKLK
ncbi:MAG: flavin reductase family protein [Deltaproteobacteria bacterium]|nr:flavin reductase family protein [Deltaproteobacteria bacterium]